MQLTNYEIYNYTQKLNNAFADKNQYLPAKINFFIQKNAQSLAAAVQEIEKARLQIIHHYGVENEETNTIEIPPENMQKATSEIDDLFSIIQDINIHALDIEKFGDIELTVEQMNALMFMIEGE